VLSFKPQRDSSLILPRAGKSDIIVTRKLWVFIARLSSAEAYVRYGDKTVKREL
jgi:hypothetical protein